MGQQLKRVLVALVLFLALSVMLYMAFPLDGNALVSRRVSSGVLVSSPSYDIPAIPLESWPFISEPHNLDILLIIDNSHSLQSKDPDLLRIHAARMFVDLVKTFSPLSVRIGAVSFGENARVVYPLTKADRLNPDLIVGEDLKYTDFPRAFDTAWMLFNEAGTFDLGRRGIVILFTDGRPCTPQLDVNKDKCATMPPDVVEGHFENVVKPVTARLSNQGVRFYIIGLGSEVRANKKWWEEFVRQNQGEYIHIRRANRLFEVYHSIFRSIFSNLLTNGTFHFREVSTALFTLPISNPVNAIVTIIQENSTIGRHFYSATLEIGKLRLTQPIRLYSVFHISSPYTNYGKITFSIPISAYVWVDALLPDLDLILSRRFYYVGQPIEFVALFRDKNNRIVKGPNICSNITSPQGDTTNMPVWFQTENGSYNGRFFDTDEAGLYKIKVWICDQSVSNVPPVEVPVQVKPLPTIEAIRTVSPDPPLVGRPITIEIVVDHQDLIDQSNKNGQLVVDIYKSGQLWKRIPLRVTGKVIITRTILSDDSTPVPYEIKAFFPKDVLPLGADPVERSYFFVAELPPNIYPSPEPSKTATAPNTLPVTPPIKSKIYLQRQHFFPLPNETITIAVSSSPHITPHVYIIQGDSRKELTLTRNDGRFIAHLRRPWGFSVLTVEAVYSDDVQDVKWIWGAGWAIILIMPIALLIIIILTVKYCIRPLVDMIPPKLALSFGVDCGIDRLLDKIEASTRESGYKREGESAKEQETLERELVELIMKASSDNRELRHKIAKRLSDDLKKMVGPGVETEDSSNSSKTPGRIYETLINILHKKQASAFVHKAFVEATCLAFRDSKREANIMLELVYKQDYHEYLIDHPQDIHTALTDMGIRDDQKISSIAKLWQALASLKIQILEAESKLIAEQRRKLEEALDDFLERLDELGDAFSEDDGAWREYVVFFQLVKQLVSDSAKKTLLPKSSPPISLPTVISSIAEIVKNQDKLKEILRKRSDKVVDETKDMYMLHAMFSKRTAFVETALLRMVIFNLWLVDIKKKKCIITRLEEAQEDTVPVEGCMQVDAGGDVGAICFYYDGIEIDRLLMLRNPSKIEVRFNSKYSLIEMESDSLNARLDRISRTGNLSSHVFEVKYKDEDRFWFKKKHTIKIKLYQHLQEAQPQVIPIRIPVSIPIHLRWRNAKWQSYNLRVDPGRAWSVEMGRDPQNRLSVDKWWRNLQKVGKNLPTFEVEDKENESREFKHIWLYAPPGSGKTMLVEHIETLVDENSPFVMVNMGNDLRKIALDYMDGILNIHNIYNTILSKIVTRIEEIAGITPGSPARPIQLQKFRHRFLDAVREIRDRQRKIPVFVFDEFDVLSNALGDKDAVSELYDKIVFLMGIFNTVLIFIDSVYITRRMSPQYEELFMSYKVDSMFTSQNISDMLLVLSYFKQKERPIVEDIATRVWMWTRGHPTLVSALLYAFFEDLKSGRCDNEKLTSQRVDDVVCSEIVERAVRHAIERKLDYPLDPSRRPTFPRDCNDEYNELFRKIPLITLFGEAENAIDG